MRKQPACEKYVKEYETLMEIREREPTYRDVIWRRCIETIGRANLIDLYYSVQIVINRRVPPICFAQENEYVSTDEVPPRRPLPLSVSTNGTQAGVSLLSLSPSPSLSPLPSTSSPSLRSFSRVYARTCFIAPSLGHISVTPVLVNQRRMPGPSLLIFPPSLSSCPAKLFFSARSFPLLSCTHKGSRPTGRCPKPRLHT